ncbi:MAG: hypothetical protein AAF430_03900 [Myxococcota bacterium]
MQWRKTRLALLATCALVAALAAGASAITLAEADAAWTARSEGADEARAESERVSTLVAEHVALLDADPEDLGRRWRLLRALHFAGDFGAATPAAARTSFDRAREVSEAGLAALAASVAELDPDDASPEAWARALAGAGRYTRTDLARVYFWSAINWGAWSRSEGLLATVRQGVANRLERYARITLALEPAYESGGAYRLLGRLHGALPRVPLISGWVDRDRALPLLDEARAVDAEHPGNRLLTALTLLDLAPDRRDEALALLEAVAASELRDDMRVEHAAIRREARAALEEQRNPS